LLPGNPPLTPIHEAPASYGFVALSGRAAAAMVVA
jgi:hypothetical protein